jgi:hypothetical protein
MAVGKMTVDKMSFHEMTLSRTNIFLLVKMKGKTIILCI